MNNSVLWLKDLFDVFPISNYEPIYGPIEPTVVINKTPLRVHVSGLFRSLKNKTIHAVLFTPYNKKHSVLNDPIAPVLINILKPFVKKHLQSMRPQVILHVFGIGNSNELLYQKLTSNNTNKTTMNLIKTLVSSIEEDRHYPIVPCPFSCEFKTNCFPGVSYNE